MVRDNASTDRRELVRSAQFNVLRVEDRMMYVLLEKTLEIRRLPIQVIEGLRLCSVPRTIDEHTRALINSGLVESAVGVTALIKHFCDIQLLVGVDDDASAGRRDVSIAKRNRRPLTVAFVTKDRPEYVSRALAGFGANFRKHGQSPRVVVVDASVEPESQASTTQIVAGFRKQFGLPISVVGQREKAALYEAIVERLGFQVANEAKFLLGLNSESKEVDVGASMNYLLLSCGRRVLCRIDDDVLPRFFSRNAHVGDGEFCASDDGPVLARYESRSSAMEGLQENELDCLGEMEHSIDKARSFLDSSGCWAMAGGCAPFPRSGVFRGHDLASVSFGTVGDCGSWSNEFVIDHLTASPVHRTTNTSNGVLEPSQGREVFTCFDRHTISARPGFTTMCSAIVSPETAPPFFPRYRNSDGVWATTISTCTNALHASLPYAVLHDPPARAQTFNVDWFSPVYVLPVHFVVMALVKYASEAMSRSLAGVGITELGRNLVELASGTSRGFSFVCTSAISLRLVGMMRLATSLPVTEHSASQKSVGRGLVEALDRTLEGYDRYQFRGTQHGAAISIAELQSQVEAFGRALQVWADVQEAGSAVLVL